MQSIYEHPTNGYREVGTTGFTWLWCFLFGFFFHLYKGDWKGAIVNFVAAVFTCGISWFVMPFFSYGFIHRAYQRAGWRLVTAERPYRAYGGGNPTWPSERPSAASDGASAAFIGIGMVVVFVMAIMVTDRLKNKTGTGSEAAYNAASEELRRVTAKESDYVTVPATAPMTGQVKVEKVKEAAKKKVKKERN